MIKLIQQYDNQRYFEVLLYMLSYDILTSPD